MATLPHGRHALISSSFQQLHSARQATIITTTQSRHRQDPSRPCSPQARLLSASSPSWRWLPRPPARRLGTARARRLPNDLELAPWCGGYGVAVDLPYCPLSIPGLDALTSASITLPAFHPGAATLRQLLMLCRGYVLAHVRPSAAHPMPPDSYVHFFDGGSRGNSGSGGSGAVVLRTSRLRDTPQLVWSAAMNLAAPNITKNQGEYVGLVTGLAAAARHHWRPLEVVGDSLLILRQMKHYHPPKNQRLATFYRAARHLADQLGVERWFHHLRVYNKMADAAANVAMDSRPGMGGPSRSSPR